MPFSRLTGYKAIQAGVQQVPDSSIQDNHAIMTNKEKNNIVSKITGAIFWRQKCLLFLTASFGSGGPRNQFKIRF